METGRTAINRENQLARLIFAATDLSAVQRLDRFLSRHPELWLTLSDPLRAAVEKAIRDTNELECLVNGPARFASLY